MELRIKTYLLFLFLMPSAFGLAQEKTISEKDLANQRLLIEGNKYFLLENYEEAKTQFSNLIHEDQDNSAAMYGLARIAYKQKDFKEAERLLKEAIKYEGDNAYYFELQTSIRKQLKDYAGLAETYQKLASLDPDDERHKYELSKCYDHLKDYKSAISVLEEIEGDGSNPSVAYKMANIYMKMGKSKKALQTYEKLINSSPGETRYMHMLANHYRSIGENESALEVYKQILKIDPEDSHAGLAIANSKRNTGSDILYLESIQQIIKSPSINPEIKIKELIPFVQKLTMQKDEDLVVKLKSYAEILMEIHAEDAAVYALAGDIYNLNDEGNEALHLYEQALAREKGVYTVWEQYMYLLADQKDYQKLLNVSNEALDFFPNRARVNLMNGLAQLETGEIQSAKNTLHQALLMGGRDMSLKFEAHALLGQVYFKLGEFEKSDAQFDNAIALNPGHKELLANYAYFLAEANRRLSDAHSMAEKAYNMSDDQASANLAFAWVLAQEGDVSRALTIIEAGLSQPQGQGSEYLERYGDILFMNGKEVEALENWQKALQKNSGNTDLEKKIKSRSLLK